MSLADAKNYEWEDGTSDDVTYIFKIGKAKVTVPNADATKFTYTGAAQTYTIASSSLYTVSNNVQTNVGLYEVSVALKDSKNYMWNDGTTNVLTYNFIIRAEQVDATLVKIPTVTTRSFVYNGKTQSLDIPESEYYTISNNKKVSAGRYVATLSLTNTDTTMWEDGTKEDIQFVYYITKATVDIPEIDHTRFVYTGAAQTYKIAASDDYTVTGNVQTKVGQYEVTVALNDVSNYMWSDGTVDDLAYNFVIRAEESKKIEVAIPSVVERKFIYNGKVQSLDIKQSDYYTVNDNKGVDVGRYTVTLSLVNADSLIWENGSTDDVLLTFTIAKAQVDFPATDSTVFVYNGKSQTYDIAKSSLYTVSNNKQVDAGRYDVNIALNDTKNYEWEDGTFEDLTYRFLIDKAQVDEPKADTSKFIFNGKAQTYYIVPSSLYTAYGTTQTSPGKYEVLVSLNDSRNYRWCNGTNDDLIYNFVIRSAQNNNKVIDIPTAVVKNFIYDGKVKSLAIADSSAYKISGNSGIDAGRYTVTLSLTDTETSTWSDGTKDDVKMVFTIAKAQVSIPGANDSTFIYNGKFQTYTVNYDTIHCKLSNNVQKNAGKYAVKLSLKDSKNYEWTDGTVDNVNFNFTIDKAQVAIPDADNRQFFYNGKQQVYQIALDDRYTVEGDTQMMPGKYEVLVSLKDANDYEWSNGTTEALIYNFVIRSAETQKTSVVIPTVVAKNFIYDGTAKSLNIASSKNYTVSGNKGVNAGRYTVTLALTDPTKTVWSDGSTDDVKMVFTIAKAQVEMPDANDSVFTYNGKYQTYSVDYGKDTLYSISNNYQKNAGKYAVKVSLIDAKNYEWSDGSVDDLSFNFTINKAKVSVPAADNTKFVYTGSELTYKIASNSRYTIEGNKQTMPGKYVVLVTLKDTKNYEWNNGTTDVQSYNFVIRAEETELKPVTIPSVLTKNFIYDGTTKSLAIDSCSDYTIAGNAGVNAGRYTVTLSLTNPTKTVWSDGSTDDVKMVFTIAKAQVEMPDANKSKFVYNGKNQTYALKDSLVYTISNNVQKNAGRYIVTVALNDVMNYEWSDGSIDDLSFNFTINKAQVSIPSADTTKFVYTGEELTYKLVANSRYTITGNKQTLPGKYEVLVSLKDTKNYEWTNGTIDDLIYNFTIRTEEVNTKSITIPSVLTKNFIYDGTTKSLAIDSCSDYTIAGNAGVNAGRYTVTLSLTNPTKTVWSDGSTDDVKMVFTIAKAQVEMPDANKSKFVYTGKNLTYALKDSSVYTISNNVQKNAGRYIVTVALNDAKNYEWSDGSIDNLSYNFTVNKAQVSIPSADTTKFVYTGEELTYKLTANSRYTITGNKQTLPGKYEVLVSLKDTKNYEWTKGTIDDLIYNFTIRTEEVNTKSITIPSVLTKNFIYDGTTKSLAIDSCSDYTIAGNAGVNAGRYTVTLSLTNPTKTVWSDGSTDDVKMVFTIARAQVEMPDANKSKFVYTGKNLTYVLKDSSVYTISNNVQKNAGRYIVTVALNDANNYEWSDGSIDNLSYNFTVNKAQVSIPSADTTKFVYTGEELTYKLAANSRYTITGNKQTLPGKYEVLVSLKDTKNYEWTNGTIDDLIYNFTIRTEEVNTKSITIPSVLTKNFIYDGTTKSLAIDSCSDYTIAGNAGVNAGRYTVTLSLTNPTKTVWSDGSTDDVKMVFTIAKAQVEKPEADNSKFVYTGKNQTYVLKSSSAYTISNDIQKYVGHYLVTVALNDAKNYEWSDGSIDNLSYSFTINKAQVAVPAADNSKFVYTGKEQTYKLATNSRYTIDGNKQTMPGKYEVLVTLKDVNNYEWANGTTDVLSYTFVIRAVETELTSVSIPTVLTKNFVYDGTTKSLAIASSKNYTITGNAGVDAGRYTVTLALTDPVKTIWSDGSSDDVNIVFTIAKAQVDMPGANDSVFTYNGKYQTYSIDYGKDSLYSVSNNYQKYAGKYAVKVSLKDAKNYEWSDGSVDDLSFNFTINRAQVAIPAADNTKFVYTGSELTYKIATNSRYTIEGNQQTMPGKYEVLVTLKDAKNYEWSNGTTEVLSYNFVIRAVETELTSVSIPTVLTKNFVYDGTSKSLAIANSKDYTITGNKGVDAGRYTVTLALTDPEKTVWSDGSVDDIKMSFTIAKAQVEIPATNDSVFTYNGKYQIYSVAYGKDTLYTVTNNSQKEAGKYAVKVSLIDAKNYEWSDGSMDDLSYSFTINKAQVAIPSADNSKFVYTGKEQTYKVAANSAYSVIGNTRTDAGNYIVSVILNDNRNYVWTDGTSDVQKLSFVINKAQVEIPVADNTVYVFDGKQKIYKIAENALYNISGNKQTLPGSYEVVVSLADLINYEWTDGTTTALTYNFVIRHEEDTKKSVEIPSALVRTFTYDGTTKSLAINKSSDYTVTGNAGVNAGRYSVRLSLVNPDSMVWSDGSTEDILMSFQIVRAQVAIPNKVDSAFIYNGKNQTYGVAANSNYTVSGNVRKNAGHYEVTVSLNDDQNYEWSDGSVDNLSYSFIINKAQLVIPVADTVKYTYTGEAQTYQLPNDSLYIVSGNIRKNVGRYDVSVALLDAKNYEWTDGTVDDLNYTFVIRKVSVDIPAADTTTFVYNAAYQVYNVAKSDFYSVSGERQINVGNHDVVISLNDSKNYEWSNGTVGDIVYSFLIVKQEIDITTVKIPVVEVTKFTFDSTAHTLAIPANDNYTVSGNTKTDAGKYIATVSLKDKQTMVWEDGSTDDISIPFVIAKATVKIPEADTSDFVYTGKELTYAIAANSLYKVSGNVQTLVGRHLITVSLVDYANYMWEDGTSSDLQYTFVIRLKDKEIFPVAIPVISQSNFIYNGEMQTVDIAESSYYTISGNSQKLAGSYTSVISLNDKEHTSWEDGTTADIVVPFTIAKAKVEIPVTDSSRLVYNGDTLVYAIAENPNYKISGNANVEAGNYQAMVALVDKANTEWENGSTADLMLSYAIVKAQIEKPVADSVAFVYSGDTVMLNLPNSTWYKISGNREVKAGKYNANVALLDKANSVWSDGSSDDVVIPFSIAKAQIEIPVADSSKFFYTGDTLIYAVAKNKAYTVSGNAQSMVGKYSVLISLKDAENYSWTDGSSLDLVYPFIINEREVVKTVVAMPEAANETLVYNGEMQTFQISADSGCVVEGNVRKNAGRYVATVSLADRNTMAWEDGTTDDIVIPFTIAKAQVEIPEADTTEFVFNGEAQTYNIPVDSLYTIEGNVQTNVGRYDVFVSLVDMNNYEWSDGTTGDWTYRFAIVNPVVLDTINPDDVKMPDGSIEAGDTVVLYDRAGDYIYDIAYDSLAHKQGFKDVTGKLGDEGIKIIIPETAKPGKYTAVVTIKDINGTVITKNVEINVCYPSALIVRLMHDVVSVNNTGNEFESYQWYKNGEKIDGATKQFYCDPDGVKGEYKVQVVNVNGDTLFIAERYFEAVVVPFNITLSKNPVKTNEQFTVTVEGVTDTNILASSSLTVYNLKGVAVYNKVGIEKVNELSVDYVGGYVVVVRISGGQTMSKHLLVK